MVIDTSALIAMLFGEPEEKAFAKAIGADRLRLMSAATAFECALVASHRKGETVLPELDVLLSTLKVELVPFDMEQLAFAREAWVRYGRGRHAANLNLGDCFAYALAMSTGERLLFKGDDFAHTDVVPAT